MFKYFIWPLLVGLTLVLTLVFIGGFATSVKITSAVGYKEALKTEAIPVIVDEVVDTDGYHIVILGDSIGVGIGDEEGKGLGNRYSEKLKEIGEENIVVDNLAVAGAITVDLKNLLNSEIGDKEIKNADFMIISIGGNDLNRLMGSDNLLLLDEYPKLLEQYKLDMTEIFKKIRALNENIEINLLGLYNPYGNDVTIEQLGLLMEWNYESQLLVLKDPKIHTIGTYDLFEKNLEAYLSIDRFHPSALGYAAIVDRLYEANNGRQ